VNSKPERRALRASLVNKIAGNTALATNPARSAALQSLSTTLSPPDRTRTPAPLPRAPLARSSRDFFRSPGCVCMRYRRDHASSPRSSPLPGPTICRGRSWGPATPQRRAPSPSVVEREIDSNLALHPLARRPRWTPRSSPGGPTPSSSRCAPHPTPVGPGTARPALPETLHAARPPSPYRSRTLTRRRPPPRRRRRRRSCPSAPPAPPPRPRSSARRPSRPRPRPRRRRPPRSRRARSSR
jgi:hypothetical protein